MMSDGLIEKLLDVVEATNLQHPDDDFVVAAFAMLALAISRLPAAEREATLQGIEDGGALRRAVQQFFGARQCPEVPDGYLN
jgi:hypothetical protein